MSRPSLLVLFLTMLATLQLTTGQHGMNMAGAWGPRVSGWGQAMPWGGSHMGSEWGRGSMGGSNDGKATTAVCSALSLRFGKGIILKATITRSSSGWFGSHSELELEVKSKGNFGELSLVLTELGATDNNLKGCKAGNLGNIVTRQDDRFSLWKHDNSNDGVIDTFTLNSKKWTKFSETYTELPISSVNDAWGCGIALCTEIEEVESEDGDGGGWAWGWKMHQQQQPTFRCVGSIPVCCHFGKSDGESDVEMEAPER